MVGWRVGLGWCVSITTVLLPVSNRELWGRMGWWLNFLLRLKWVPGEHEWLVMGVNTLLTESFQTLIAKC
jgi:hypothetical protein